MSSDSFRVCFKYFKAKDPPPDLSVPLDLQNGTKSESVSRVQIVDEFDEDCWIKYGLKAAKQWDAYTIHSNEGLIFIKNPFYDIGQRFWIIRCLRDFPKKPNKTNLDAHYEPTDIEDWWKTCSQDNSSKAKDLKKNLRWSTFGYHHDWDTKMYSDENKHGFPLDLADLCRMIVSCFGFNDFEAQASIVNYYHMDSTLSSHTDHSEKNLDAPLISISFGQSAIFLIGGKSKHIEPTALYIHSGDIVIMSKQSRLSYHAVPRIVQATLCPWDSNIGAINIEHIYRNNECENEEFWKPFSEYLKDSRININIRQVLHKQKKCLNYDVE